MVRKLNSENFLKIIKHFGIKNQVKKLNEECFELLEAITRYEVLDDYIGEYVNEKKNIAEEMVDVLILINQIWEYYNFSDEVISEILHHKLNRTLDRIESGYYDKK